MSVGKEGAFPLTVAGAAGYVIGLTIFINADGRLGLFENGLRQNVIFLYRLFKASPACARVYLLNHGDGDLTEDCRPYGIDPADIVRAEAVTDRLDLVLNIGAAMPPDRMRALRDGGTRIHAYKGGNGAVISMEAIVARPTRADAERYFDHDLYDGVLLTPQHWRTYRGWCESVYRCPVRQVPQVWAPWVIEASAARERFGYRPGGRPWRIGVLEPNITVMKTSHLPMLVCESAYRTAPAAFRAAYIANGWAHRDDPHFASFARSLSIVQSGVMTFEPRFVGVEMMADHCDAVVAHQWENGLNYLYYEALHGGYPLIHNSAFLADQGYPYADFDPEDGGRALLEAKARHDDSLRAYRDAADALIERLRPDSPANIRLHETLLGLS